MKPIRFYTDNPVKLTREDLGLPPKETETMDYNTFSLLIPECDTCKRGDDSYSVRFPMTNSRREVLVAAGMYDGHPANYFQDMPAAKAADEFNQLASNLLKDPLKYMEIIEKAGDRGDYEQLVKSLMRFAGQCEHYVTAKVVINADDI